jgi:hypothetical protein
MKSLDSLGHVVVQTKQTSQKHQESKRSSTKIRLCVFFALPPLQAKQGEKKPTPTNHLS